MIEEICVAKFVIIYAELTHGLIPSDECSCVTSILQAEPGIRMP